MKDIVHVFSTTDLHGEFEAFIQSKKVQTLKNKHPEAIWIDNGDFFIGNALTTYYNTNFNYSPLIEKANSFQYDVMVPGNHDLDYGLDFLKKQVAKLSMPYVCCNLFDLEGNYIFEPYTVIQRKHLNIAVIGIMTEALPQLSSYENNQQIICEKAKPAFKKAIEHLPENIDLIIVAYHGGLEVDLLSKKSLHYPNNENGAYKLAEAFPQINGFIAGHQHFTNAGKIGECAFVQPGSHGKVVGQLTFSFEQNRWTGEATIHTLEEREEFSQPDFQNWLNDKITIASILDFLSAYFKVEQSKILFEIKGDTRRDFLKSLPRPHSFFKYAFSKAEWAQIVDDQLNNQVVGSNINPVIIYTNKTSFPHYRLQKQYIDNLFDAYHQWLVK